MAFTVYRSTDGSAPVLTGQAGALTTALDAILVNGYGAKGAAGWTTTFTATNKRVYRPAAGTRLYLRVHDNGTGAGGGKEALLRGAEAWSDIDTPDHPFPTAAQSALTDSSLVARKSVTADATARAWVCFADGRTCYFLAASGDTAGLYVGWMFGDFFSLVSGDVYNCALIARSAENSGAYTAEQLPVMTVLNVGSALAGHYLARGHTGLGTSVGFGLAGDVMPSGGSSGSSGVMGGAATNAAYQADFLNAADGGIYLAPLRVYDPTTEGKQTYRGRLRGLWQGVQDLYANVADGDTLSGVGDLAGRSFVFIKGTPAASAAYYGVYT